MANPRKQDRSAELKEKAARSDSARRPKKPYTREDFDRDLPVIHGAPYPEDYTSLRDFLYR